jgi:surface protein
MFWNCSNLTNINFSSFNAPNVRATRYLFAYCSSLVKLDLSSFYTAKIADFVSMFQNCYSLTELDLSNFEIERIDSGTFLMARITTFQSCNNLSKIKIKKNTFSLIENMIPNNVEIIFV